MQQFLAIIKCINRLHTHLTLLVEERKNVSKFCKIYFNNFTGHVQTNFRFSSAPIIFKLQVFRRLQTQYEVEIIIFKDLYTPDHTP